MMSKFIVLDIGGLLVDVDGSSFIHQYSEQRLSEKQLWTKWLSCQAVQKFEEGKIDINSFGESIVNTFGLNCTTKTFIEQFPRWVTAPSSESKELLQSLKEKGHQIYCLTNTNSVHWKVIESADNFLSNFEKCFPSHMIGYSKPTPYAYKLVKMSLPPNVEIYFFDDQQRNVEAARKVGFIAHCVRSFNELKECLEKLKFI